MKKLLILAILIASNQLAFAQNINASPIGKKSGSIKIVSKDSIAESERAHMSENKKIDPEGYSRLLSSDTYVSLIQSFAKLPIYRPLKSEERFGDFQLQGEINEDQYRKTYIYENVNHQKMMVTVWKYVDAGATMYIPSDVITNALVDLPSIFNLATSTQSNKALWKAAVWSSEYFVEVYVEDSIGKNSAPLRTYLSVQTLVRDVARKFI
jgi:hypothetical protein